MWRCVLETTGSLSQSRTAAPVIPDFFGITAQGVGTIGMFINLVVTVVVSLLTPPPPAHVQEMVEGIRYPRILHSGERVEHVV